LVLLFPRARLVPRGNACTESDFDYVLYLGSLVWCVELAYLENRFHVLSGQWDLYLLATAGLFFFLAYRFDNRFVLSLALSSLAGWFGLTISHWPDPIRTRRIGNMRFSTACWSASAEHSSAPRPETAFLRHLSEHRGQRSLLGIALRRVRSQGYGLWFLALLIACGASLAWGLRAGSLPSLLMPPSTATWASARCSSAAS
jgi:hypothetical protein